MTSKARHNGRASKVDVTGAERPAATADAIDWVAFWWEQQGFGDTDRFLAMTSVFRLHQLMINAMTVVLKQFDLNPNSYLLLATIELSDSGARLLSHLASRIMVHPTTVTVLADRLEQQGLLVREPHPTDRRAIFARITPAGRALMKEATRVLAAADFGLPAMSEDDCRILVDMLRPVRAALGEQDPAH